MRWLTGRAGSRIGVAALLSVCALLAGCREKPTSEATAQSAANAKSTPASDTTADPDRDVARRLAILDNGLRAIEDGDRESPRDRWDSAYVVEQVGKDPQALFAWVRDHTVWIPYRGVLRGDVGVLMDRRGNSLDRAILLATLFEKADYKTRLAYRELSESEALKTAGSALDVPDTRVSPAQAEPTTLDNLRAEATRYNLNPDVVARTVETHNQFAIRMANALDARVADQTRRLLKTVTRPDPSADWVKRLQEVVSARREHWWVQLESGGTWEDFDVDAANGMTTPGVTAERTLLLEDLAGAQLHHDIVVRVTAEQWSQGIVARRTAMEHTLRPAELIGEPIVVQFLPISAFSDSLPTISPVDVAVGEQAAWAVSLSVGSEPVASGIIERRVGGGGPLGGLGGAIANMAATDDRELSAVWIEYEVRTPGEPSQTITRTIFDLIGPAARAASSPVPLTLDGERQLERALALTQRTELLPIACRISLDFVRHLLAENLIRNRNLLRIAIRNFNSLPDESLKEALEAAVPPVTPLYRLALARLDWGADEPFVYINRLGLLTAHTGFVREGSQTLVRAATDIVANPIGVSPAVWDAFALRVAHGVLDTNLEAFLHSGAAPAENTAAAFALPHPWVTLARADSDAVAELQLSDDVRQRIREDQSDGSIVVAPRSPVLVGERRFSGWWRIDAATGQTLGIGANGWGTAGEYSSLQVRNFLVRDTLRRAGLRAFWVFNTTAGFCLVQEVVTNVEKMGPWPGLKAVVVENPNQCAYQGLFWGAVATLPLVILTVNIRLTAVAPRAAVVAGEAGAVGEGAAAGVEGEAAAAESSAGKGPKDVNPLAQTQDAAGFAKTEAGSSSQAPPQGKGGGGGYPQPFKPGPAPPGEGPYHGDPGLRDWLKENPDHPLSQMIGGRASYTPEGTEGLYRQADAASTSAYNAARSAGQGAQAARQASHEAYWNYLKQGRGDYMQRLPSGGFIQKKGPGTIKIEAGSAGVAASGDVP